MATLSAVQLQDGDPTGANAAVFDVGGLKVQAVTIVDPDSGSDTKKVTILSAQTHATGTAWSAFTSTPCKVLDIVNSTQVDIEYRRDGAGVGMPIPARSSRQVVGITDADQIEIRRVDQLTTQVTIHAEAML